MKRIATTRPETTETMVTFGIPGTTTVFKLGDVACHTYKDNGDTIIFLPKFVMSRLIKIITGSEEDYKDKIRNINDLLKMVGINKHVRHDLERQLIKSWGNHKHAHLRRYFI